jgi:hypothetical protein
MIDLCDDFVISTLQMMAGAQRVSQHSQTGLPDSPGFSAN